MKKPRPTDEEFDALKARRDDAFTLVVKAMAEQMGAPADEVLVHRNHGGGTPECYCGCPDGPCQHVWNGPARDLLDDRDRKCGEESTCSRCGMGAMHHDLRMAP